MPTITREHCAYIVYGRGHGKEGTLVQTDWDYPATAETFGWSLRRVQKRGNTVVHLARVVSCAKNCEHHSTDGTVDCKECGLTASAFIGAASEFLDWR